MELRRLLTPLFMLTVIVLLVLTSIYLNSKQKTLPAELQSKTSLSLQEVTATIAKSVQPLNHLEHDPHSNGPLTQERFFTEKEVNEMTEEKFIKLLHETTLKMPRISDIKKLPAEALHHTPPLIIQVGKELGLIKEILNVHASYENVATPFYKNCAQNEESPTAIRALCLNNLIALKKKSGEKINKSEYPSQVLELAKLIDDI